MTQQEVVQIDMSVSYAINDVINLTENIKLSQGENIEFIIPTGTVGKVIRFDKRSMTIGDKFYTQNLAVIEFSLGLVVSYVSHPSQIEKAI